MPKRGIGMNNTKYIIVFVGDKKDSEWFFVDFPFSICLHSNWFFFKETHAVKSLEERILPGIISFMTLEAA